MGGAWAQHDSNHGWIDGVAVVDVFVVSVFFIYIVCCDDGRMEWMVEPMIVGLICGFCDCVLVDDLVDVLWSSMWSHNGYL